jgi:trimeric autotransporter adhesin
MKKIVFFLGLVVIAFNANAQKPFISEWNISRPEFIFYGKGANYEIKWECIDCKKRIKGKTIGNDATKIPFEVMGKYKISVTNGNGVFNGFDNSIYRPARYLENKDLEKIVQWGSTEWEFFDFSNSSVLDVTATDIPNFKKLTSLNSAFSSCYKFKGNASFEKWDVSNITDMNSLFEFTFFNQNINNWNVSKVKIMINMFSGDDVFNQPLDKWDVSNVTEMGGMFESLDYFNHPLNMWNVSKVTNMNRMFAGAKSFNQPLDKWDVSNVTNMSRMFDFAEKFNQPLNMWNVSKVTDMQGMFRSMKEFNQPLDKWNVSRVTKMLSMFYENEIFNQPLDMWDVSNVTEMQWMFKDAKRFQQPLAKWNVWNVKNMEGMFFGARNFYQSISNWNILSLEKYDKIFDGCYIAKENMPKLIANYAYASREVATDKMFKEAALYAEDQRKADEKAKQKVLDAQKEYAQLKAKDAQAKAIENQQKKENEALERCVNCPNCGGLGKHWIIVVGGVSRAVDCDRCLGRKKIKKRCDDNVSRTIEQAVNCICGN